jgi:hypothetical protein
MATGTNVASKDVAVKQEAAVPAYVMEAFDDFGDDTIMTSTDYQIPRLTLMHGTSGAVTEGKAVIGEYRSSSGELVAGREQSIEFIICKMDKYWRIKETDADGKYLENGMSRREEFTLQNSNREWEFKEDGKHLRAYISLDLYLILANPDGEQVFAQMPMILTLQSTGYSAARTLNTELQKMKMQKLPAHAHVFVLSRKIEKVYCVPTIAKGRKTTAKEMEAAAYFRSELKTNKVTVSNEGGE